MRFTQKVSRASVALAFSIVSLFSIAQPAFSAAASGQMPATMSADSLNWTLLSSTSTTPTINNFSSTVRLVVTTTNGVSKITTTTGLTAPTGYSTSDWTAGAASIGFEGTQSAVNNAIATLSFKGTTPGVAASVKISAIAGGAAYNPDNGHYYKIVNNGSSIQWSTARANAKSDAFIFNGMRGYLATITSSAEQSFLYSKTQTTGWIGATDGNGVSTNQVWKWADGPEAGQTFWTTACGSGSTGICSATGMYNNWNTGEPNGVNGSEDDGEFGFGASGQWNDCQYSCSRSQYIIEYGGMGETATEQFEATTTISVAGVPGAPTITSLVTDNSRIGINFSDAAANNSTITKYQYSTNGGTNWSDLPGLTSPQTISTTSTGSALSAGTSYSVIIRAINSIGNGTQSASITTTLGSPTNADAWGDAAQVCPNLSLTSSCTFTGNNTGSTKGTHTSWSEGWGGYTVWYKFTPIDSGTVTIRATSSYDNTLHLTNSSDAFLTSNDDSYGLDAKVTYSVAAGQTYYFALGAYSSGQGPATLSVSMSVPTPPVSLTASTSGTSGTASLSWTASSASAEGTTSYQIVPVINGVEVSPTTGISGLTLNGTPPSTSANISGLTNGTTYTFKVRSVNANGNSAWSTESNAVTIYGPAAAPTSLTKAQDDQQVQITFTQASGLGLSGGTFVRNEYRINSGTWVDLASATTFTATGLTNGTSYTFNVRTVTLVGATTVYGTTASITGTPNILPVNTGAPLFSGTPRHGETFTVSSDGTWTGGGITFSYKWQRSDSASGPFTDITGATSSSYTNSTDDLGKYVRLSVIATNSTGSRTAYSGSSLKVLDSQVVNSVVPSISGTKTVGQQLTASTGTWQGTRITHTYQWYRADSANGTYAAIGSATSATYSLQADDANKFVKVVVTATNSSGAANAESLPTTQVSRASQSIVNFTSISSPVFSAGTVTLSSETSSALQVEYTSSTPTVCSVGATTFSSPATTVNINFVSAGDCSITAEQPGNAGYLAATPVSQTFYIALSAPTVVRNQSVSVADTKITVSWATPLSNGGSPIASYLVTATSGSTTLTCTSTTTSCAFEALTQGATYEITITPTNTAVGASQALSGPSSSALRALIPAAQTSTTTGNIPARITPKPPTTFLGAIPPATQTALINSGVIAPPPAVPVANVTADLSTGSINTPTTVVVNKTVESGSEIDLAVIPPADTPIGTPVYGTLILAGGKTYDLGQIAVTSGNLVTGIGPNAFTILPVGIHYVELRFGQAITSQSVVPMIFTPASFGLAPLSFSEPIFRTASSGAQINIRFEINIVAGPNGVPKVTKSASPTPSSSTSIGPSPSASSENTPTPSPSTETLAEPAPVIDPRGLEVVNPVLDAPAEVAQTTLTAVTLVAAVTAAASAATAVAAAAGAAASAGAAAAAGGAAGSAAGGASGSSGSASRSAGGSSGGSSSGGSGSSSSNSGGSSGGSDPNSEEEGEGSVANIDFEHDGFEVEHIAWGDGLKIWSSPVATLLDKPSHNATGALAPVTPLVSKLISDGAYLRAIFGVLAALLPALGIALGVIGVYQAGNQLLPPSAFIVTVIAAIGVFDAFAGFLAMAVFALGMQLTVGIHTAGDLRMMAGLFIIGFGPALLAGAFRGLRKAKTENFSGLWERLVDLAVAPFMGGWATKGMVEALPALAGVKLPLADYSVEIAWVVAIGLVIRVLLEEFTAHFFPSRLNFIHPADISGPHNVQKVIALTMRAGVFWFVAGAFIGTSWHLYVGTFLFIAPSYLALIQDRFPNYPKLYQILPAGLPGLAFTLLVASYSLAGLTAVLGETPDLAKLAFVFLPIPSVILSILGMLGREPADGDVRWYQRENLTWLYRIGGVLVLIYTMRLTGIL